jgi:hypothetical protein
MGGRARGLFTLGQVSLSTVLLVGAGLFVQSLRNALDVEIGFDYDRLITVEFERQAGVDSPRIDALYREALAVLSAMPWVERAVLSSSQRALSVWDEQHDMRPSRIDSIAQVTRGGPYTYAGTAGFAETAGIRIAQGRAFASTDYASGAPFALMVSRSFAEGVWPGLDPGSIRHSHPRRSPALDCRRSGRRTRPRRAQLLSNDPLCTKAETVPVEGY